MEAAAGRPVSSGERSVRRGVGSPGALSSVRRGATPLGFGVTGRARCWAGGGGGRDPGTLR